MVERSCRPLSIQGLIKLQISARGLIDLHNSAIAKRRGGEGVAVCPAGLVRDSLLMRRQQKFQPAKSTKTIQCFHAENSSQSGAAIGAVKTAGR